MTAIRKPQWLKEGEPPPDAACEVWCKDTGGEYRLPMTTATDYRQYAHECMESARTASSDAIRKQFLDLATLWMTAAARSEGYVSPVLANKMDGHSLPNSAAAAE